LSQVARNVAVRVGDEELRRASAVGVDGDEFDGDGIAALVAELPARGEIIAFLK